MRNKVVYIATHSWRSPVRVGSHHIAEFLGQSSDVLYTSHPLSIASMLSRKDNQRSERLQLLRDGINTAYTPPHVKEMTWFMPFAPSPNFPFNSSLVNRFGPALCWPKPSQFLRQQGYHKPRQLWVDSLFQYYWKDLIEPDEFYVRVADHPAHITNLSKPMSKAFLNMLQSAQEIVTPTMATADYLSQATGRNVNIVPNGVNVEHFSYEGPPPAEYHNDTRPKAVFVGALASWIDIGLIAQTATRCPEISFYLIGPNHALPLKNLPENLINLGSRSYAEIPAYLAHADVALAPFDVKSSPAFIESIDAIKLYEYIAAGLPTVATTWSQSLALAPYVIPTEQTATAFASSIKSALDHPEQYRASQTFINSLDWTARLANLQKIVG